MGSILMARPILSISRILGSKSMLLERIQSILLIIQIFSLTFEVGKHLNDLRLQL